MKIGWWKSLTAMKCRIRAFFGEHPSLEPSDIVAINIDYIELTSRFTIPGHYSWAELFGYLGKRAKYVAIIEAEEILKICDVLKDLGYKFRSNTDEEDKKWGFKTADLEVIKRRFHHIFNRDD